MSRYNGRILLVDDDDQAIALQKRFLESEHFVVETASCLSEMKDIVKQYSIDAVLLDLNLGEENGLDGIPYLVSESPFSKIFMVTGEASVDSAVSAMKFGADGYVEKSKPLAELAKILKDSIETQVSEDNESLSNKELHSVGMIGRSESFRKFCESIYQLKDVDSTVLVLGESGTGKEVVARALHKFSERSNERFAAINCAAIPETLLESELFGHQKGAFTDAKASRTGIFELCSKGTLLLDEIGDMPLSLQAKLLRVLQEKTVIPVGGSKPVSIDTRIIAATHRDLIEEVQNGRFREDLYYRLSVIPIVVPPLRHRKSDIEVLCNHFIDLLNEKFGKNIRKPGPDFLNRLLAHDWPGNIRELKNSVERAVVLARNDELKVEDLFRHLSLERQSLESQNETVGKPEGSWVPEAVVDLNLTDAKQAFEKQYITEILDRSRGNITEASKRTGRYRADIYRLLEKFEIDHNRFKG